MTTCNIFKCLALATIIFQLVDLGRCTNNDAASALTPEDYEAEAVHYVNETVELGDTIQHDTEMNVGDPIAESGKFEGDIMFPEGTDIWDFADQVADERIRSPPLQSAIRNGFYRWKNGVVPYVIPSDLTKPQRQTIAAAILDFAAHTCIKWKPRTDERDYVNFVKGITDTSCYSFVGKIGGKQSIHLGPRCFTKGIVIHEMMHAVGFYHEQSRADRDKYVNILLQNVIPTERYNFQKYTLSHIDHLGTDYDCGSIMHYGPTYFAKSRGLKTITPKTATCRNIGQRKGLSQIDIEDLNRLYKCRTKPRCFDIHDDCAAWAKQGRCKKDRDYMLSYCKKSCDGCSEGCYFETENCFNSADARCRGGNIYHGIKSTTANGVKCQAWATNTPHKHSAYRNFPNNYCRDMDSSHGAWCYTTDPAIRWDYCFKSSDQCTTTCYNEFTNCFNWADKRCRAGSRYFGTKATTAAGIGCQVWAGQEPHKHKYTNLPSNYCRDQDVEFGAWCYTTDPKVRWDYCYNTGDQCNPDCHSEVSNCFNYEDARCQEGNLYFGTKATTATGRVCQGWAKNSPHKHDFYHNLPSNLCRDVDSKYGPWCYITDPEIKWDYCFKSSDWCTSTCYNESTNCFTSGKSECKSGHIYFGTKSTTATGTKCQTWASNTPHKHKYYHELPSNYCRDIDSKYGPWCYTIDNDVIWEYCFAARNKCD